MDAKRYERAEFLIATAQEEMGKAYMLLDMCRVDLARHQNVLRHLCRSFYSHPLKHVYFDLSAHQYAGIRELPEVQYYFRLSAREWWPSAPESGEPDMPHSTYFLREANLYIHVDSYSDTWVVPSFPAVAMKFEEGFIPSPLQKAREALGKLRATQNLGLIRPEALQVFNRVMKRLRVREHTPSQKLLAAYERAGRELEVNLGVPLDGFMESELHNWPLHWIRR